MKTLSLEQFKNEYKPIQNPYQEEIIFFQKENQKDKSYIEGAIPIVPRCLWSVHFEKNKSILTPGYYLNGELWCITAKTWEDENIQVLTQDGLKDKNIMDPNIITH